METRRFYVSDLMLIVQRDDEPAELVDAAACSSVAERHGDAVAYPGYGRAAMEGELLRHVSRGAHVHCHSVVAVVLESPVVLAMLEGSAQGGFRARRADTGVEVLVHPFYAAVVHGFRAGKTREMRVTRSATCTGFRGLTRRTPLVAAYAVVGHGMFKVRPQT